MAEFNSPWHRTSLSKVGLGTGRGFGDISVSGEKARIYFVHEVFDQGINWVDTASNYCDGSAETIIGKAAYRRDDIKIFTKFSTQDASPERLTISIDKSLRRLKRDKIDLIQFHWPNTHISLQETCSHLMKMIEQGKIDAVGVGNFSLEEIQIAKDILGPTLVSHQHECNLFNRLSLCETDNFMVRNHMLHIEYSPFLGLPFLTELDPRKLYLYELAEKYQTKIQTIVLGFLLHGDNRLVITGSLNAEHVISNLMCQDIQLSDKEVSNLNETFPGEVEQISINKIELKCSKNYTLYETQQEAEKNTLDYFPSPLELASEYRNGKTQKPILLKRHGSKFLLIGGMVRFWAWYIATEGRGKVSAIIYG